MSTDLEALDAEIIGPMDKKPAQALDKRIRALSDRWVTNREQLLDLLDEAARGQIYIPLGYSSWTAYVKDAVQIPPASLEDRKALAIEMSGKGMPQRAIAAVLGVGKSTINRDLEAGVPSGTPDEAKPAAAEQVYDAATTGIDGKTYKRKPKPEFSVDEEPEDEPPVKAPPITQDFRDEVYQLQNNVEGFKELILEDERFAKARAGIAKSRATEDLRACIEELDDLLGVINGGEAP